MNGKDEVVDCGDWWDVEKQDTNDDDDDDIILDLEIDDIFHEAFYKTDGWDETDGIIEEWDEALKERFQKVYIGIKIYVHDERLDPTTNERYKYKISIQKKPDDNHIDDDTDDNIDDDLMAMTMMMTMMPIMTI